MIKRIQVDKITLEQIRKQLMDNIAYYTNAGEDHIIDIQELIYQKNEQLNDDYDFLCNLIDLKNEEKWIIIN